MKTICALATPPGIGGIAVIRISGEEAIQIAANLFSGKVSLLDAKSHTIHYGKISSEERMIDTVTASVFRKPNSYTGEDVVEISCHGGIVVTDEIINELNEAGAELAEPGEFTRRAFLNGKLDLAQVEAVADLIHSESKTGAQTAARQLEGKFTERLSKIRNELIDIAGLLELELDFSEEEIEITEKEKIKEQLINVKNYCTDLADSYKSAEILRSGYFIAIAGYPNSGKSTLFNTLLNRERAIVSPQPGTTRDYLEEPLMLGGIKVKLIDTAGIRETRDIIEIEGIRFAESALRQANLILVLNDISISHANSDTLAKKIARNFKDTNVVIVQNKADKINAEAKYIASNILISAKKGYGIETLKKMIEDEATSNVQGFRDVLINKRQAALLKQAAKSIGEAICAINRNMENELISIDIRDAAMKIGGITGESWSEQVLNNIFKNFCIGK